MIYRIAIGTKDKIHITEHFGQCKSFMILDINQENDEVTTIGMREVIGNGQCEQHEEETIRNKIEALKDCHLVLVKKIGGQSEKLLLHLDIVPLQYSGRIDDSIKKIIAYYKRQLFVRKE